MPPTPRSTPQPASFVGPALALALLPALASPVSAQSAPRLIDAWEGLAFSCAPPAERQGWGNAACAAIGSDAYRRSQRASINFVAVRPSDDPIDGQISGSARAFERSRGVTLLVSFARRADGPPGWQMRMRAVEIVPDSAPQQLRAIWEGEAELDEATADRQAAERGRALLDEFFSTVTRPRA